MTQHLILALDQGTTNTKALLVNREGVPVFRASVPLALHHPRPGYAEQDADEIWLSVRSVAAQAAAAALHTGSHIAGIAISNQRETAVTWTGAEDGSAVLAGLAVSWQCRRSAPLCALLAPHAATIRNASGLPLDPLLTAGKWATVLRDVPTLRAQAEEGRLRLGTVDTWLVWQLTGGKVHATDHTNASRTGLLNLQTGTWDDGLLALFGVPRQALPELRTSSGSFGVCTAIPELAGVPIVAVIGDSHAAMVGHCCFQPGTTKATYGTGSSLMTLTDGPPHPVLNLARTIAWSSPAGVQFALEGNIAMTGAGLQWMGEFLGLKEPARDAATLAETVPDAGGAVFVPAQVGLGAPYWQAEVRGALLHLESFHTGAHAARAALDAIAHQVADVYEAMQLASGLVLAELHADGGPTRNTGLMQFQADMLGATVVRSADEELSAVGAALLGGLHLGWWSSLDELAALPRAHDRMEPEMGTAARATLRARWAAAVRRVLLNGESSA